MVNAHDRRTREDISFNLPHLEPRDELRQAKECWRPVHRWVNGLLVRMKSREGKMMPLPHPGICGNRNEVIRRVAKDLCHMSRVETPALADMARPLQGIVG
ncbi:MAG: hypothetical protein C0478_10415 [Planctomyces sp.]|nr:hypothetical protein [Planctomyces sp.]